ncbi:MAG TPA: CHAT domain-containing tetratricopeptide repeat protein [Ktedonosporobacter sp.]|jgi:tetratricopeptide (TPR) repeat protein|nr:CHAT domain-containing tetratricopeptide repeat protein [Ktedonosporobacter sp.]
MAADSLDAQLYADFVQELLYLGSVRDIQRAVGEMPNLDSAALYQALDTLEKTYTEAGAEAQRQLLLYVRKAIDDVLQPPAAVERITNVDELIQQALHAQNMTHVYILLRNYRHLLNEKVYQLLQLQTPHLNPNVVDPLAWVRILCVTSLLLGKSNKEAAAKAHFFWVSYCRDTRQFATVERHLLHAVKLTEGSDDVMMVVGIIGLQASFYERFGEVARAAASFQHLLALAERANNEHIANSVREGLARCYHTLGRDQEALELLNACLAYTQKTKEQDQEARYHFFKGVAVESLGRYEEGEVEYRKAADLAESLGDRVIQFKAMINIGLSLQRRDNVQEAITSLRATFKVVEKWGNPVMVASMRNNLGNALLQLHQESATSEALGEFMKALPIKASANDTRGEVISYIGVGDALDALGEYEDAKTFYGLALGPALELLKNENEAFGAVMYATRVASGKAALSEDTIGTIVWARDITRETGEIFQELILTALLIDEEAKKGDQQRAIELCREAIGHCQAMNIYSTGVMDLHIKLAKLLMRRSDGKREAYHILMGALASIEKDLQGVLLNRSRAEVIAKWIKLYGMLIALLVENGHELDLPASTDLIELAFNLHEAAKARAFLANLASTPIAQPEAIPQELREQESKLLMLVRDLQRAGGEQYSKSQLFRFERLREMSRELHDCWEKMRPFAAEYVRMRSGEPARLQDVRALLSEYATVPMAFVSFFCDEDITTCFVVRSDEPQVQVFRSAIGRKRLREAARLLRRELNGEPNAFPAYPPIRDKQPWKRDLHDFMALSDALLTFLPAVQGVELLCIAPHGPLHLLPFHALRVPDGSYLIEHFAVVYCPSLSTLRYSLQHRHNEPQETPSVYVAGVSSRVDAHPEFFEQDDQLFAPDCWQVTADIGVSAATKERVLQQAGNYDVVHLTCHGYFDEKDPLNSGVLLANGQEKPPRNPGSVSIMERSQYLLTARDFLRIAMGARIVTLRACSTAIQRERNSGDELEGVSRSLLYAGNAAVVVSLWNVNQESSQQLMVKFYHYWAEAEQPVEKWRALQMAQRDFLNAADKPFLNHPYHWAPLIVIGDWR